MKPYAIVKQACHKVQRGFSLIEIALVLVIVGLALGGIVAALGSQLANKKISDTQKIISEANDALVGFAIINGRLPRPATSAVNGAENPAPCANDATCTGLIPWAALGVTKLDAYGKILRYSVTPAYANALIATGTAPTKQVSTRNSAGALTLLGTHPAVIYSHGNANFGTTDTGGAIPNGSVTNIDEITNNTGAPAGQTFIQRPLGNAGATGGEFDDILLWLPRNTLINRMAQANKPAL
jgi:prepilin-type N-terminal cleavage/methylation domain-containing protein